jgi:hypothetical protein
MQGRRVETGTSPSDLAPGDCMLAKGDSGDWWIRAPKPPRVKTPERAVGTLTVGPVAPGEQSSIAVREPGGWHGWLRHGVWVPVPVA